MSEGGDVLDRATVASLISSVIQQIESGRLDQAVAELRSFQLTLQCSGTSGRPARSRSIEAEAPTVPVRPFECKGDAMLSESERLAARDQIAKGSSLAKSCDVGFLLRKGKTARREEKKEEKREEKREKKKKKRELKNSKKKPSADDFSLSAPNQPSQPLQSRPPAPSRTVSSPLQRESTAVVLKGIEAARKPSAPHTNITEEETIISPRANVERSEKQQKQYSHVVRELFDTERGYIRDLDTIIELFKVPLEKQGLVTAAQSAVMFSNVEMLRSVNSELLRQLENITAREDEARLDAHAEANSEGMSQEELDTLKQIPGIMTVTVVDNAGFQFDKRLPIDGSVTYGRAREMLVQKLAPLVPGGARTYENYRLHSLASNEIPRANQRVLESVGFKKTELQFMFKRDTNSSVSVGGALLNMAEYLKAYTEYCSNQLEAMELAAKLEKKDKDVKLFLRKALKDKRCRQLDLNAFLIMPLQRVCKYPLLIRELIGATPDGHEEKPNLEKAAALIGATVRTINDSKKEREGLKIMREINEEMECPKSFTLIMPTRRYVSQGKIGYLPPKSKDVAPARYFFFNDIILINSANDEDGMMHYQRHIELKNAFINAKGVPDAKYSITVSRPGKNADPLVLVAKNEREHKRMTEALQQHVMRDAYSDWVSARQRSGAQVEPFEVWFKTYGKMFLQ